jgi:hypothetical protein
MPARTARAVSAPRGLCRPNCTRGCAAARNLFDIDRTIKGKSAAERLATPGIERTADARPLCLANRLTRENVLVRFRSWTAERLHSWSRSRC